VPLTRSSSATVTPSEWARPDRATQARRAAAVADSESARVVTPAAARGSRDSDPRVAGPGRVRGPESPPTLKREPTAPG
jgi:hypothetical protein